MATENWKINHPVATGASLDSGAHQGLFGYDTTTGRCRFQFGALAANAKSLANYGDAPTAHKASHEYGGSDALVGQNIAGLRTSDSPNFTSTVVSGVTRISSGGAGTFTGLTSTGGATISGGKTTLTAASAGYASLNIPARSAPVTSPAFGDVWSDGTAIVLNNSLSINAAARPAWSTTYSTFNPHGTVTLASTSGVWLLVDNLYNDGTNSRGILTGSYASSFYASASDGALKYDVSATTTTAGGVVADMATRWQVSRQGGVGFFGVSAPTTRPTLNAACTDLSTAVALINQIRANLIACGMMQ